jgi:hypothetical protein
MFFYKFTDIRTHLKINVFRGERTNCMHRNRGNLTVGLKTETIEMVGIIFPRPPAPKPTVLGIMFCCRNFIKTTVYTALYQIKYVFVE